MIRIGLMSDTHGFIDPKIYEYFKDVDEIWHAGDIGDMQVIDDLQKFKPLIAVHGNIDGAEIRTEIPEYQEFHREGMKVLMTHIAGRPGRYVRSAHDRIKEQSPDIFVCGHSHILVVKFDKDLKTLWLNPGACGYKGFHQVKTLLRFCITDGKAHDMEVIELGNRV